MNKIAKKKRRVGRPKTNKKVKNSNTYAYRRADAIVFVLLLLLIGAFIAVENQAYEETLPAPIEPTTALPPGMMRCNTFVDATNNAVVMTCS